MYGLDLPSYKFDRVFIMTGSTIRILLLLTWLVIHARAQPSAKTRHQCLCQETNVICPAMNLTRVPCRGYAGNFTSFVLSSNAIASIGPHDFANDSSLMWLDLSHNVIHDVSDDAFGGLESLRLLNLSFNKLKVLESNKERTGLFYDLRSLCFLDLSHNSLTTLDRDVFVRLFNLHTLDLSHNNLTLSLGKIDLNGPFRFLFKLTHLDISDNKINKLHESIFFGLFGLQNLNLANNNIPLSSESYPEGVFATLESLTHLHLEGNWVWGATGHSYPDKALSHLKALQALFMDGLPDTTFGPGFKQMKSLIRLSVSGVGDGVCFMNRLSNGTFHYMPTSLRVLDVSYCNLSAIDTAAFEPLKTSLHTLDLSNNSMLGFDTVGESMHGLQGSVLRELRINFIVHAFALNVKMTIRNTRYFKNTNIERIYARGNRLEVFCRCALDNMPDTLTYVDLTENRLTFGSYFREIGKLKNLQKIEMDGHAFMSSPPTHYPPSYLDKCDAMPHHIEQDCGYPGLPNPTVVDHTGQPSDGECKTADNPVLTESREGERLVFVLPPNLKTFKSRFNQLNYRLHNMKFDPNNSLTHLDLSNNLLSSWGGGIEGLNKLTELNLYGNLAHTFDFSFFKAFPVLVNFTGSSNYLRMFLINDTQGQFFAPLRNLKYLFISENFLNHLPHQLFQGLANLKQLDLSDNYLDNFDINISHMHNLTLLNLSLNSLNSLPEAVTEHLDSLADLHNITLDISHNPIDCMCKKRGFLEWVQSTAVHFPPNGTYYCHMPNGTKQRTDNIRELIQLIADFQSQCSKTGLGLFVLAGAACFCLLTALLSAVAYRYRWKLRYLYYTTRLALAKVESQHIDNFHFDAFICFAEEDGEFVHEQLTEELETQAGLRLNIHNRDFTPGRPITCNIVDAIQNSRRTIVVLSRAMLRSDWCGFELQMAMMEAAHTGRDVVIFLLYEDLSNEELPRKVLYYLHSCTHVTYPGRGDLSSLQHFWARLALAIRHD